MASEPSSELFRERAQAEAARYGSDPWVFVRELLQNARDAGARRVEIEVSQEGESARVSCRDDGCGMSYEHARSFLFALYASSKEDSREQAGKFGIGFWSVLRFEPSTITIRSRGSRADGNPGGDAWQVSLDGGLGSIEASEADLGSGTEIVLERPVRDGEDLTAQVMAATRHYGRFVTRRADPETPLPVTVNGHSANAPLKLEAPCATFHGKGFRGAVGLGEEPEVELFAQGLFVRSASSLQDLQAAGDLSEDATTEGVLAELPSLAPRVLIDSAELDLLLARSDARHDKHLHRILRTAEKQLGRLITRQLQALRPQPFYRLWFGALRDRLEPYIGWHVAAAGLIGLMLGLGLLWALPSSWQDGGWQDADPRPRPVARSATEPTQSPAADGIPLPVDDSPPIAAAGGTSVGAPWQPDAAPGTAAPTATANATASQAIHAYVDLANRYHGPRPGGLAGHSRLAMTYQPEGATPFFAALVIDDLAATRWAPSPASRDLRPYQGVVCSYDCVKVSLLMADGQTTLRIPVPTGHRLDTTSVRLDSRSWAIYETASGEALLRLPSSSQGLIEYSAGPAQSGRRAEDRQTKHRPQAMPEPPFDAPVELMQVAEKLRRLPTNERIQDALEYVVKRVVYDRSPAAGEFYQTAQAGEPNFTEPGFIEVALKTGVGDCDVQSGVLVNLLRLADVEARLALGYVGTGGTVSPGLHAWVEVRDPNGGWSVVDPSITSDETSGPLLPADSAGLGLPNHADPRRPLYLALPLVTAGLLLSIAAWAGRQRSADIELSTGKSHAEEQTEHLAALLSGALQHPETFAGLPAMFHGRFVPLLSRRESQSKGGRTQHISLARARRMGSKNRLFRSSIGSELARRAAARGVAVIDASTAEGRVLSLALGAIDIDHWSSLLKHSLSGQGTELSQRINRRLDTLGANFRLRETSDLAQPWVEIALEDLKLGQRQILVDLSHLEYAPVHALADDHPEAAAFTMLDVLLHRIELPESERPRILAAFAAEAVEETAQPSAKREH